MQIHAATDEHFLPDHDGNERLSTFLERVRDKRLCVLELGIGSRNQLIKAPFMRLVASLPKASYVTINLGEICIADNIRDRATGLDGALNDIIPALRSACERHKH